MDRQECIRFGLDCIKVMSLAEVAGITVSGSGGTYHLLHADLIAVEQEIESAIGLLEGLRVKIGDVISDRKRRAENN